MPHKTTTYDDTQHWDEESIRIVVEVPTAPDPRPSYIGQLLSQLPFAVVISVDCGFNLQMGTPYLFLKFIELPCARILPVRKLCT